MATTEEKQEKFIDDLNDYLVQVPDDDKMWIAFDICREVILNVTCCHLSELGFIELLKDDLKDFHDYCFAEDKKKGTEDKKDTAS